MRLSECDDGLTDYEWRLIKTVAGMIIGYILGFIIIATV